MLIKWNHQCFLCSNPIDICVFPDDLYEIYAYYHYRFIYNPAPLFMNHMYLKHIGKRMRRVCTDCFTTYKPVPFRVLRDREIGVAKLRTTRRVSLSLTKDELMKWCGEMPKFFYPEE